MPTGSSEDSVCLCVPGYPSGRRSWELLAQAAPRGWRTLVVDLPDGPAATLGDQEDAIAEAVLSAGGTVTLVGHSLGAYLAARVLPRLGERVARAVLIGGFARLPPEVAEGHAQLCGALERGELAGAALRDVVHGLMVTPDARAAAALERIDEMLLVPAGPDLARMVRRGTTASLAGHAVTPFVTPAWVVHGTEDRAVALALGEELAGLGANSEMVRFDGAGHFVQLFHAERLARIVFGGGSGAAAAAAAS